MMLLPSGRSNSDVYPQQNSNKVTFTTSTSSPLLYDKLNQSQNGHSAKIDNAKKLEAQEEKIIQQQQQQQIQFQLPTSTATPTPTPLQLQPIIKPLDFNVPNGNKNYVGGVNDGLSYQGEKNIPAHYILNTNQLENIDEIERQLNLIQNKIEEGWTVHVRKDGRLYYCK